MSPLPNSARTAEGQALRTLAPVPQNPESGVDSSTPLSTSALSGTALPLPSHAAPHHTDPTLGAALFAAWSGDPAVVVASPPGAGKTRLVIHLAEQLNRRAGLTIAIATQTRAQAFDVTNRAAAIGARVALLGVRDAHRPMDLHAQAGYLKGAAHLSRWKGVVVATTARWLWVNERDYTADVCIVDFSSRPCGVFHVGSHLRRGVWRTAAGCAYATVLGPKFQEGAYKPVVRRHRGSGTR